MTGVSQAPAVCDGICDDRLCGRMKQELRFFSFMEDEDLDQVGHYFECRQVSAGEKLWQEGEPGNFIAFIVSGRIELRKETEFKGRNVVVGVYSQGSITGELSILDQSPRTESAVALDQSDLILLTHNHFKRMMSEHPTLGNKLLRGMLLTVSQRLKKSYDRLASIF
jgi:CRP-like cAMP-binding protein